MADSYNELFGLGSYSEDASLEGWWKLQDNAASTAVADSSSQATDQVLVGGSNTSDISASGPGFLPLSLNFDGTSDFCERAGIARSDVPLSLCARFEANTSSGAHAIVSWGGTADEHVLVQVNSEIWALSQTTTNARAESPALVSTGSWQSAVAVFEAAAIRRIFVDGVLRATNTQSIAVTGNGQGVRIAQRNNADQKFTGSLADVAVFSRALSSQEVSEYDAGPEPIRTVDGSHNISGTDASIIVPTYDSQSNGTVTASWEYRRLSDNAVIQSGTGNATMTGLTPGESYYTFFRGSNNGGHAEAEDQTTAAQQAGSGQAAISGDAGEFVIAGQDAIVLRSHDIASDEGAFSVSGQDINAVRGLSVEAEIGSYLFSGQDSNIARGLVHSPSQAAITLSGQDADFSLQSGLTIAAEQATFTIAGQDAAMIQSLVLVAAGGSFAIAGQDSLIGNQLVIVGDVGSLGLTGQDANLLRQFFEKADTGSFSLAGKEITFEFGGDVTIISESGFFSADGQSASIRFPSQVSTKRIGFRIDGRKVILQGV